MSPDRTDWLTRAWSRRRKERAVAPNPLAERGYEGHVAKDERSAYEPGPTRRWLKVKVPGWTVAEDRWQRRISAGA